MHTESPVGHALTSAAVETPAFVIDDAKLTRNLKRGLERAKTLGVTLRPHLKTHKSITIARRQMEHLDGPATVSTLEEARWFAERGVSDLIYAVGIAPEAPRSRTHPPLGVRFEDHFGQRGSREDGVGLLHGGRVRDAGAP